MAAGDDFSKQTYDEDDEHHSGLDDDEDDDEDGIQTSDEDNQGDATPLENKKGNTGRSPPTNLAAADNARCADEPSRSSAIQHV